MASHEDNVTMISAVASAIGPDLCADFAFVGGCTTGLLLTDSYTRQQVRHTDDVDLIVHVISRADWYSLLEKLRAKGFKEDMHSDAPICAMYLDELRVDFMPDDPQILSFSNVWYKDAYSKAMEYQLKDGLSIRLVRPEYFVATKLEAYLGRGNHDPLGSRDIEDILILIDGRPELSRELLAAPVELRKYVSSQLKSLTRHSMFEYAVSATANEDPDREALILERIKLFIGYGLLG